MNNPYPQSPSTTAEHWYAAKVYFNKIAPLLPLLERDRVQYFDPTTTIPSLLFIRCSDHYVKQFRELHHSRLWIYSDRQSHAPTIIAEAEMETFIFVVTAGAQGLQYLGDDKPEYHLGDRVRVTAGPLKGAEGHIKRIKKDRRLIVTVRGVAAIATAFIHPDCLEKVTE